MRERERERNATANSENTVYAESDFDKGLNVIDKNGRVKIIIRKMHDSE